MRHLRFLWGAAYLLAALFGGEFINFSVSLDVLIWSVFLLLLYSHWPSSGLLACLAFGLCAWGEQISKTLPGIDDDDAFVSNACSYLDTPSSGSKWCARRLSHARGRLFLAQCRLGVSFDRDLQCQFLSAGHILNQALWVLI